MKISSIEKVKFAFHLAVSGSRSLEQLLKYSPELKDLKLRLTRHDNLIHEFHQSVTGG